MDVVDLGWMLAVQWLEAKFVARAVVDASFDAAAAESIGEHKLVLIALLPGLPGEFGGLNTAWPAVIERR